ncbi:ABC transporter ATP-binding protein [Aneurinibacillus sp. REN35]|uniref:ABC transporter ATP-binding protein n=1 Tax=Aneurinibacillus sp. REN35 TaxID=3237286 RepID=UPI0035285BD8
MASLQFNHVKKRYGTQEYTVKDFHLEVADKEFLVLVGPSGCGKSTTLRMIAGLEEISEGEFYIGDRLVNDVPPKDRDIAMVFQNYALYPHMSVYENMAFGLKLRKLPKQEVEARVREAARTLDIEHLLDRKPKALSGGQRQRVALGRAMVRNPQVFLMDEPLSNLDAKLRVQMRTEISKLHRELQTTIVYVTHDQTEAMTMADRIVVMYNGVIQQVATPQEIYHTPANTFVAGFIGSPAMNFLEGVIEERGGNVYFAADSFSLLLEGSTASSLKEAGYVGKAVILGIRPEHILPAISDSESAVMGDIDMIENTGAEAFVYITMHALSLVAKWGGSTYYQSGQSVPLYFDREHLHFFDKETKEAIALAAVDAMKEMHV